MSRTAGANGDAWWHQPVGSTGWMDNAICRQVDPDLWHPGKGEGNKVRKAKAICATCPVQAECLSYAMRQPGITGILGGTTERERRRIRKYREERRKAS
jgi:WhiB family transcriptional regulator, redox-sensing transcriptional regulator